MKIKMLAMMAIAAMVLVTTSCNKVPQVEIDAAKAAVDQAQMAGANVYLPDQYAQIQDSMKAVLEQVEVQKSKLFGRYGDIKAKLERIKVQSAQVKTNTEVRIQEIKQEIQTTMAEVTTILEENKALMAKAPKGKEGKAALEMMTQEMTLIEGTVQEANQLLAQGDLLATLDKAKAAKEKALGINSELKEVVEKYTKKTGKK